MTHRPTLWLPRLARSLAGIPLVLAIVLAGTGFTEARPAAARVGTFGLALIRIRYADTTSVASTEARLVQAGNEIRQHFRELSYGRLDVVVTVKDVRVSGTRDYYELPCRTDGMERRPWCSPQRSPFDREDAAQAAAAAGMDWTNIQAYALLHPYCGRDFAGAPISITRPGVRGTFQSAHLFECPPGDARWSPPGPSGVWWNGWAHEVGHMLQLADGIVLGGIWNGHPSAYSSGYDLMDSGYPNHESVYALAGAPIVSNSATRRVFNGWLASSKVATVPASATPATTRIRLAPLSQNPGWTSLKQGIKLPIAPGVYYTVEARTRLNTDARNIGPGIWDEGVKIQLVNESSDPPVSPIDACDTTEPRGCVRQTDPARPGYDDRSPNCNVFGLTAADKPAYCYGFRLWQPGQTFTDSTNNLQIRVESRVASEFNIVVTRGAANRYPDVSLTPWNTLPMRTWETVDIWVDSSCNGYESDFGVRGLRYGRRGDGTVIGNGDDLCLAHANRLYARVRNGGTQAATNVRVRFKATNVVLVGRTRSTYYTEVGSVVIPRLEATGRAGSTADVFVTYVPRFAGSVTAGRSSASGSVKVVVDPVPGEISLDNQDGDGEQENINRIEALYDINAGVYTEILDRWNFEDRFIDPLWDPCLDCTQHDYILTVQRIRGQGGLPAGSKLTIADGRTVFSLKRGAIQQVPVRIQIPPQIKPGQTFMVGADVRTLIHLHHDAMPKGAKGAEHLHMHNLGGITLAIQTVVRSTLKLGVQGDGKGGLSAFGTVTPAPPEGAIVAIDYRSPKGKVVTRLVKTDAEGRIKDSFMPALAGTWTVQALWMGDLERSSAASLRQKVDVGP